MRYQPEKVADENATRYLNATSKPAPIQEGSGVADKTGVSIVVEGQL